MWPAYLLDRDRLQVPAHLRSDYRRLYLRTWKHLDRPPDILSPESYNDKIKWLMLFARDPAAVRLADKLAVRDYVREAVGGAILNDVYAVWDRAEDIDITALPQAFVLKTNHDSGSVWVVPDKSRFDTQRTKAEIAARLARPFGREKGEWHYSHIIPKAFAEEYLSGGTEGIPDYKFHCASGRVAFVQYITDRATGAPREMVLTPDGRKTGMRLDHHFDTGTNFAKPGTWEDMIDIAERLSAPFRCVRVDLYDADVGIRFGEMTFFPRNGNFRGGNQVQLGRMIQFDMTPIPS